MRCNLTERSLLCQRPLTHLCSHVRSLENNKLTNYGADMSGVVKLAEGLKGNTTLTSLK